jgi:hypothetical protein
MAHGRMTLNGIEPPGPVPSIIWDGRPHPRVHQVANSPQLIARMCVVGSNAFKSSHMLLVPHATTLAQAEPVTVHAAAGPTRTTGESSLLRIFPVSLEPGLSHGPTLANDRHIGFGVDSLGFLSVISPTISHHPPRAIALRPGIALVYRPTSSKRARRASPQGKPGQADVEPNWFFKDYINALNRREYTGNDYLPHDAAVKSFETGLTRLETLTKAGRKPVHVPLAKVEDRIHAAQLVLPACRFDSTRCEQGLAALREFARLG